MEQEIDVLIVGSGLIGLTLGAALCDSGLQVTIVDRQHKPVVQPPGPKTRDGQILRSGMNPRVVALGVTAREFLTRIDVWHRLAEPAVAYRGMEVWDGEGTGFVSFSAEDAGLTQLGYIVQNNVVEDALMDRIGDSDNVTLTWGKDLTSIEKQVDGYRIESSGVTWQTALLVGADGSNSTVRKLAHLHAVNWAYDQIGIVTTVETELAHQNVARQWFTDDGVLAFLPRADPNLCSIVLSTGHAEGIGSLNETAFAARLELLSESRLGRVLGVDERLSFPLSQLHSLRYVIDHLALIGDAVHTIHPLAGQGANIGLADAQALAGVVKQAKLSGRSPGDLGLLRGYQQARRFDNIMTAAMMELLVRGFASDNAGVKWLRSKTMNFAQRSASVKNLLTRYATLRP